MKTTIEKTFDFDAAHALTFLPETHKCHRMHGHTYRVTVVCEGEPDANGMLIDYAEIAAAWAPIHDVLDHRTLNNIPGLECSTTERLAEWVMIRLVETLPLVSRVIAWESSTTCATVCRSDLPAVRP